MGVGQAVVSVHWRCQQTRVTVAVQVARQDGWRSEEVTVSDGWCSIWW